MAIMSPGQLPLVLKVPSDPMKKYVLTKLGFPAVDVEMTEDQFEVVLQTTGDFIAGYFPREQRFAWFMTQPLVSTYPMPKGAYWVQEVAWDPISTNVADIFGAESYLFCLQSSSKILAADGSLQPIGDWKKGWKAKTPYGNRKLKLTHRTARSPLPKLRVEYEGGVVSATSNHAAAIPGSEGWGKGYRWREFQELTVGCDLVGVNGPTKVSKLDGWESQEAVSVKAMGAGCYWACDEGEPVLLH